MSNEAGPDPERHRREAVARALLVLGPVFDAFRSLHPGGKTSLAWALRRGVSRGRHRSSEGPRCSLCALHWPACCELPGDLVVCARCVRESVELVTLDPRGAVPSRVDLLAEVRRALRPRYEDDLASALVAYLEGILPEAELPAYERRACSACGANRKSLAGGDAAVCIECLASLHVRLPPEPGTPLP